LQVKVSFLLLEGQRLKNYGVIYELFDWLFIVFKVKVAVQNYDVKEIPTINKAVNLFLRLANNV